MKGLILKDVLTLKKAFKSYLILFFGYLVIDVMSESSALTLSVAFIISTMLPIATISYDEKCKWDKLVNTMPFSRKDIVYSKYLLGILLTAASLITVFALSKIPFGERLASVIAMGIMCLIYQAFLIPALLKFGSERGRIIMMIIVMLPFMAGGLLSKFVDFESMNIGLFIDENILIISIGALLTAAMIYILSIALSVKIYSKKEF